MQRGRGVVRHIDGDLSDPPLLERQADGAAVHIAAPGRADGLGDVLGQGHVGGRQVDVEGHQKGARADDRSSGPGVHRPRPLVGGAFRRFDGLLQPLVLPLADVGQRLHRGALCGGLVEIDGNGELVGNLPAQLVGQGHALLHRNVRDGDEGNDVRRTDAGMSPPVFLHVDQLRGLGAAGERRLLGGLRLAHEGEHRPIVIGVGGVVQDSHAGRPARLADDGLDDLGPLPLAEVRYAFHKLRHIRSSCPFIPVIPASAMGSSAVWFRVCLPSAL